MQSNDPRNDHVYELITIPTRIKSRYMNTLNTSLMNALSDPMALFVIGQEGSGDHENDGRAPPIRNNSHAARSHYFIQFQYLVNGFRVPRVHKHRQMRQFRCIRSG